MSSRVDSCFLAPWDKLLIGRVLSGQDEGIFWNEADFEITASRPIGLAGSDQSGA